MTWEEFELQKSIEHSLPSRYKMTNIECPVCKALLFIDTMVVCTSNPPQNKYECVECNWVGYA